MNIRYYLLNAGTLETVRVFHRFVGVLQKHGSATRSLLLLNLLGRSEGSGEFVIRVPPRIFGPGTYQIYLNFSSGSDPAGPNVDLPGIVGEFTLDDTSTRRGNHRNGYLSLILDWEKTSSANPHHVTFRG